LFLCEESGGDIDNWTLEELKDAVARYKEENPLRKRDDEEQNDYSNISDNAEIVIFESILGTSRNNFKTAC